MAAYGYGVPAFTPWTEAEVVGHDQESPPLPMTRKYAALSPMSERRASVEAVSSPTSREV